MDATEARVNMVKSQVVPNQVQDPALLEGLMAVPREEFVDGAHRAFAYSDMCVRLNDQGRRSLTPLQAAWLIQTLELDSGGRVLVVGAGSGYEAAVLGAMGVAVFAVESDEALAARGRTLTGAAGVRWRVGDAAEGWGEEGPFDAILVCGAVRAVPARLVGQLSGRGVLAAIVGESGEVTMRAVRVRGVGGREETLFETVAPVLPGFDAGSGFRL